MLILSEYQMSQLVNMRYSLKLISQDGVPIDYEEVMVAIRYMAARFTEKASVHLGGIDISEEDLAVFIPEEDVANYSDFTALDMTIYACWMPHSNRGVVYGGAQDGKVLCVDPESMAIVGEDAEDYVISGWDTNTRSWVFTPRIGGYLVTA